MLFLKKTKLGDHRRKKAQTEENVSLFLQTETRLAKLLKEFGRYLTDALQILCFLE